MENLSSLIKSEYGNQRQAVDAAYVAGIIDGEGFIGIIKTKPNSRDKAPRYDLKVQVVMSDSGVPQYLCSLYGGTVGQRARRQENWKDTYMWTLTKKVEIKTFLLEVIPYLRTKYKQAEWALKFLDECPTYRRGKTRVSETEILAREDFRAYMKKLNLRGAAATTERNGVREDEATV